MLLRAVIASVAFFCVSVAQADEPQWLKDARARESKPIKATAFKSKDNWFSAKVPAKVVGPVVKEQGSYSVELNIGGDNPIYCEVVPEGFDTADMLHRTYDLTLKQIEEGQGKIEAKELEFSDAGAIGNVPYLQTRWIYTTNNGKESLAGGLKQIAFEKLGHGIYCAHVDIGYEKTFDTVTRALVESFEAPQDGTAPYYFDISTATLAGKKVGIAISRLERDADGDTKASQMTSMLIATPDGAAHSVDSVHVEWIRPDASLINGSHFVSQDGEMTIKADLKLDDDGWFVKGESAGKPLDAKLGTDVHPGSWVEQALGLRKMLAAQNPVGSEHSIALWTVSDLNKLTDARTRILSKGARDEYAANAVVGTINASVTLDASGLPKDGDIPMGAQKIHVERVYQNGSF